MNNWLSRPENQKYTGAIQYCIFLDNMALGNQIYLKRNPENEVPEDILNKFEKTAKLYNIDLAV